jgi:hypothetical protein
VLLPYYCSKTERKELLFSLPRFATLAEKQRLGSAGRTLTEEQLSELGSIR